MSRKFLFCFPLRIGNLVFGYILVLISTAVAAFHLYELALSIKPTDEFAHDEKFGNWEHLESLFGRNKNTLVANISMIYYLTYIVMGLIMLIFSAIYILGIHQINHCLVSTFFVYSFFHLFLTVGLIVWEATSNGFIQLGLIVLFDVILIICLFGVKYLMEAIRTGNIYSHPGEVYNSY